MNILISSRDIHPRTLKSSEIGPNFACFWPLKFLQGGLPKTLDQHYKAQCRTDNHPKFHFDRQTHLKDLAFDQKIVAKHKH